MDGEKAIKEKKSMMLMRINRYDIASLIFQYILSEMFTIVLALNKGTFQTKF